MAATRAIGRLARWAGAALLFLVVALCLLLTLVPPFLDFRYYAGPASDHYDGERFFNPDGNDTFRPPGGQSRFMLRYLLRRDERPPWPAHVAVSPTRPPARVAGERMVVTWVGHATMLVQTQGLNILTDPIWSDTAGPFGIGPRRVTAPGVRFADLPKIDVVLISHNHYDHMDLATLKRLQARDRPLVVTSLGNDTVMKPAGVRVAALDWGQRVTIRSGVEVVVTRNHHWDSRWMADRNRALWSSFVVRLPGGNIFFAGDTGPGDMRWPAEAATLGPVRLALIPIGAFRFAPGEMRAGSHIGPVDAVKVFEGLGAAHAVAIHWGTFRLSYEAYDTPPKLLALEMRCAGLDPAAFRPFRIGEAAEVPAYAPPRRVPPRCPTPAAIAALR
ncbi:MBL fold metallo-hydrolase [Sphingomonas flavalba]|uniref:MBL fold metallo-hydrolase n=1 Tax=Sphingomonas flavalba TaxID=2559804 RepID=UPI001EF0A87E|nr:MBL fold metallo-hydrolase [Sphingomonas flavalba]